VLATAPTVSKNIRAAIVEARHAIRELGFYYVGPIDGHNSITSCHS